MHYLLNDDAEIGSFKSNQVENSQLIIEEEKADEELVNSDAEISIAEEELNIPIEPYHTVDYFQCSNNSNELESFEHFFRKFIRLMNLV